MTTQILDLNNIERKLFWVLSVSLGVVLAVYLYSAFSLMGSVVARDRLTLLSRDISTTSGEKEQEYMVLKNSITLALAEEYGFDEVPAKFTTGASPREGALSAKFSSMR